MPQKNLGNLNAASMNDYFVKMNGVKVHLTSLKMKSNDRFQKHSISCEIEYAGG